MKCVKIEGYSFYFFDEIPSHSDAGKVEQSQAANNYSMSLRSNRKPLRGQRSTSLNARKLDEPLTLAYDMVT